MKLLDPKFRAFIALGPSTTEWDDITVYCTVHKNACVASTSSTGGFTCEACVVSDSRCHTPRPSGVTHSNVIDAAHTPSTADKRAPATSMLQDVWQNAKPSANGKKAWGPGIGSIGGSVAKALWQLARISLRLTDAAGAGSKSTPDKKRDATAAVIAMPTPPPAVRARLDSAALASPELGVTDNAGERHFASHPICAHQNTAPRNLAVPMQRGSSKRLHRRWRRSSKRRRQCKRLRRRRRTLRSRSRLANVEEEHFAANPARLTSE